MIEDESCSNCRFWKGTRSVQRTRTVLGRATEVDIAIGNCRHSPPRVHFGHDWPESLYDATLFPITAAEEWCGKHEPSCDRLRAINREDRIVAEARRLCAAAEEVVRLEAASEDSDMNWRANLSAMSERIAAQHSDIELDIRARAKDMAATEAVRDILVWASIDTGIAEAVAEATR